MVQLEVVPSPLPFVVKQPMQLALASGIPLLPHCTVSTTWTLRVTEPTTAFTVML